MRKPRLQERELERIEWIESRGLCPAQDKGSLDYITSCIYQGQKGCPRDCNLYNKRRKNGTLK